MNNCRNDWTAYLNAFNNCVATYVRKAGVRGWILEASSFAADGIKREGYFEVVKMGPGRYFATRTRKAHVEGR